MIKVRKLARQFALARRRSGRAYAALALEAARLRFSAGALGVSEYLMYGLHDGALSSERKAAFVGWRAERRIDRALNNPQWRFVADDKLVLYAYLGGLGLPLPETLGHLSPWPRYFPDIVRFEHADGLRAFLGTTDRFPLFMKPVHGSFGQGAVAVACFDRAEDALHLRDGTTVGLAAYLDTCERSDARGILVQRMLEPDAAFAERFGPGLVGVRLMVMMGRSGPVAAAAVCKITRAGNMVDNFAGGSLGNLLGGIAIETGTITRVVASRNGELVTLDAHPDTGLALTGFVLPEWNRAVDICLTGASTLPGLALQHWDVALSTRGPVILEVNVEGSLDLLQIGNGRGVYDEALRALLAERRAQAGTG